MPVIRFAINNPLLVNLSLLMVLIVGVMAWRSMPQELFPVVQLDMARISTQFEGAAPAEVEAQVTIPIEDGFEDTQDIDYISSISREGFSTLFIQLKSGSNVDDFMADARTILDRLDDLPELAEEPELNRVRTRFPVITLTLFGALPQAELFKLAEALRRRVLQTPGVASVGVAGDRDWEIWVIVDPFELAALALPLERVMAALRDNLRDQPGGKISAAEGDIRLRGKGVAPDPGEIENIVLTANARGGELRLGEVAKVERRFEEAGSYARFNGQPSVNLTVTKTAKASTVDVAAAMRALAQDFKRALPPGARLATHTDTSVYLATRLNTVKSSAMVGLLMVLAALCLLLSFRVALITAFGIPVSFLFGVGLMQLFGYSINMISLFAFLIVLGMIVDDAIIVTENIYRHLEQGQGFRQAAQTGSAEVFWPVLVATFTTMAAFLPMYSIEGIWGEFMEAIPFVVCAALLGSLVEAFAVLPSHAAHLLRPPAAGRRQRLDWNQLLARYGKLLHWAVANRYAVATLSVGVLIVALAYAVTRLPYEQFGDIESGQFFINLETPNTYSLEDSLRLTGELERVVSEVVREEEIESLLANVGLSFIDFNRFITGSNLIQLVVDLKQAKPEGFIEKWVAPLISLNFSSRGTRERSTDEIINALRAEFSRYGEVKRFSILKPQGGPAGADISVGLAGADFALLRAKADAIRSYLARLEGVRDARHDQEPGKLEYKYELNDRGRRLGLSQSQLASAVRSGFLGNETVHVTWSEKRVPVRVIYPEGLREQSAGLERLPIVLPDGRTVYLGDVADISAGRGLNEVRRRDGRRMANIRAEVDSGIITPIAVTQLLAKAFSPAPGEDYELLFLGQKKEMEESFGGMYRALSISLILIFFMLTALFRSLLDPLVIMLTIPFGLIGVVAGHALFGYHLQFLSIVGVLALSGIVVNDSLILIDFAKKLRRQGQERVAAVTQAGMVRARPIALTTITTFLGVSPLIFFSSGQTRFLAPMAVSLGFGLVFATFVILLTLPCLYLIADDLRLRLLERRPGRLANALNRL